MMVYITHRSRYLASLLLETIIGCETTPLRALNAGAICLVCLASYQILRRLRCSETSQSTNELSVSDNEDSSCVIDAHSALNMSLFPPLFFFSGLYYTDVMSTLVVLLSYSAFLKKASGHWRIKDEFLTILMGITALLFRQTNIFWVAIFPAGLAVIDTLQKDNDSESDMDHLPALDILKQSWLEGLVYDLPVANAAVQGNILTIVVVLSVLISARLRLDLPLDSTSRLARPLASSKSPSAISSSSGDICKLHRMEWWRRSW